MNACTKTRELLDDALDGRLGTGGPRRVRRSRASVRLVRGGVGVRDVAARLAAPGRDSIPRHRD